MLLMSMFSKRCIELIISLFPLSFEDLATIKRSLSELFNLIKAVSDIWDCRIEAVLEEMSTIALCDLPEEDPLTVTQFLDNTQSRCDQSSQTLAK